MASEFNVDLPPRFEFTKTEPEGKEEELVDYLRRLSRAVEESMKKAFIRTAETIDGPTKDNIPKLDVDGEMVDSGVSIAAIATNAADIVTNAAAIAAIDAVPSGLIAVWHGTIANIPTGWVLCDGDNSTPDLTDKFLRCVPDDQTNPGDTAGSDTHNHDGVTGSHAITVAQMPTHDHSTSSPNLEGGTDVYPEVRVGLYWSARYTLDLSAEGSGATHNHTVASGSTLPAYYEVAFIMKS